MHLVRSGAAAATIDPNRASGTIQFTEEFTTSSLWLSHSGNDLVVSAFGSADTLDIKDWFSENPQSWSVVSANGLTMDSQLSQLIVAMDTYAQNTPGFDPMKATAMPTDPQLQSALTAAWHT